MSETTTYSFIQFIWSVKKTFMEAESRLTLIGARGKNRDYLQLNWRELKMKGVFWNWMMVLVVGKKKTKKKEKKGSDSPKWKGGGVDEIWCSGVLAQVVT